MKIVDGDSIALSMQTGEPCWAEILGWQCWAKRESTALHAMDRCLNVPVGATYYAAFGVWSAWKENEVPSLFAHRLTQLARRARDRFFRLVLVTPPPQIVERDYNTTIARYTEIIRIVAEHEGVRLLDLAEHLKKDNDALISRDDYRNHLSPAGHEFVAALVSRETS